MKVEEPEEDEEAEEAEKPAKAQAQAEVDEAQQAVPDVPSSSRGLDLVFAEGVVLMPAVGEVDTGQEAETCHMEEVESYSSPYAGWHGGDTLEGSTGPEQHRRQHQKCVARW